MSTTHRIWDFRGVSVGIVWFQKRADGSARILQTHIDHGYTLNHYAEIAAAEPGSVDYVRPEHGDIVSPAMRQLGLNPEVLPAAAWRSPAPFAGNA